MQSETDGQTDKPSLHFVNIDQKWLYGFLWVPSLNRRLNSKGTCTWSYRFFLVIAGFVFSWAYYGFVAEFFGFPMWNFAFWQVLEVFSGYALPGESHTQCVIAFSPFRLSLKKHSINIIFIKIYLIFLF